MVKQIKLEIEKKDYELIKMLLKRELIDYYRTSRTNGVCKKYVDMVLDTINNFAKAD